MPGWVSAEAPFLWHIQNSGQQLLNLLPVFRLYIRNTSGKRKGFRFWLVSPKDNSVRTDAEQTAKALQGFKRDTGSTTLNSTQVIRRHAKHF